jgi:hypothetical protein
MSKIYLILKTNILPEVIIKVNDLTVDSSIVKDEYDNVKVAIETELDAYNQLSVEVTNVGVVNLIEIIVDDIRFGLVTFLCTTVNNKQDTQVESPGKIDIELQTPIWKFWCDKMSDFNYKEYPLGSIT